METIKVINPSADIRWDKFVDNHPFGWIVHLSGWKTVLEKSFPHMKGHYLALIDPTDNEIKAALPLFELRSWLTGNRIVSLPFATLCDPLISDQRDFIILLDATIHYARENYFSPINIHLFHAASMIIGVEHINSNLYKTHQLLLNDDPDKTKKSFSRNIIRLIESFGKSDLRLRIGESEDDVLLFYQLYSKTRKRLGLPTQPYIFLQNIFKVFSPQKQVMLLLAENKGKPIGGLIVFRYKERVSSEFLASEIDYRHLNTDHFLYWNAINISCREGFKIYDFGRTACNNASLSEFKRKWGTTELDLPKYCDPPILPRESTAVYKLIQRLCKNSPTPVFNCLSWLCYRHLG